MREEDTSSIDGADVREGEREEREGEEREGEEREGEKREGEREAEGADDERLAARAARSTAEEESGAVTSLPPLCVSV